jgi:hypothetical protein
MNRIALFTIVTGAFVLGVVIAVASIHVYQSVIVPGRQVVNFANARTWQSLLTEIHENTGQYPASLEEALSVWRESQSDFVASPGGERMKDNWGFAFKYARTQNGYVLASFGSDGKCDLGNLIAYLSKEGVDESPCYSSRRDTVLTSRGFQKRCGK